MQTAVIGYPRIGTLRELKFASEQYFRKEIEAGELLQTAKENSLAYTERGGDFFYFQQ